MPIYRPTQHRRQARQLGFTVIELMLAVVIMAILAGLAAPSMIGSIVRNRIVGQASDLAADLQLARNEAFRRQQRIVVCKSNATYTGCGATGASWTAGWIVFVDSDRDAAFTTGEEILRVHQALPTKLTVTLNPSTAPAADRAYYRPTGLIDAARTYTICQPGYVGRDISITVTGRTFVAPTAATC